MHSRYLIVFCFFALAMTSGKAQTVNLSDSLSHVFKQKKSPSFKFETRNSFITGNTAKVYGIKLGVSFGKRFSVGLGYNFIGTELREEYVLPDKSIVPADIRMNYIAPYAEYSFYQKGPWEVSVPIQMGVGKSFLCYEQAGEHIIANRNSVVIYEPGMTFEYKILKLIGVGAGFGYRIMLRNNRAIDQQFTSPVYALRLRLIFDELHGHYKRHISPEKPISD